MGKLILSKATFDFLHDDRHYKVEFYVKEQKWLIYKAVSGGGYQLSESDFNLVESGLYIHVHHFITSDYVEFKLKSYLKKSKT